MNTKEKPLVGPRAGEHVSRLEAEDVRLDDGRPLYYALLNNPNPDGGVLDKDEVQAAKSRLASIIAIDRQKVIDLQGKNLQEAASVLKELERSGEERSIAAGAGGGN
ncbi:MAG: hypothetical protein A2831_01930 [Candidatus Yanofskybacteria bacterium RIFCSPHIGHO2_01_FULL_44_17]|uniref:Uncharacterized protein n=1 Tax=Candidatus Yanofskybacteria bacterium RIFCSPHIGHO2_01_FULL_44_17 TaxID=1802668 RepID=A0A1F8EWQ1_9BACT|nr:MAG: hypothetical protein A2831_01930 [Candidatus Yanofskybacteria bacterium RIFCSPHIGHO2_01_FULL_44_17]